MPAQDFARVLVVEHLMFNGGSAHERTNNVLACPTSRCPTTRYFSLPTDGSRRHGFRRADDDRSRFQCPRGFDPEERSPVPRVCERRTDLFHPKRWRADGSSGGPSVRTYWGAHLGPDQKAARTQGGRRAASARSVHPLQLVTQHKHSFQSHATQLTDQSLEAPSFWQGRGPSAARWKSLVGGKDRMQVDLLTKDDVDAFLRRGAPDW